MSPLQGTTQCPTRMLSNHVLIVFASGKLGTEIGRKLGTDGTISSILSAPAFCPWTQTLHIAQQECAATRFFGE